MTSNMLQGNFLDRVMATWWRYAASLVVFDALLTLGCRWFISSSWAVANIFGNFIGTCVILAITSYYMMRI